MPPYHVFYFRGPLLEDAQEVASKDVVDVAQAASSSHPDLTAEIWLHDRKVAVVRPCTDRKVKVKPRHQDGSAGDT